MDDREHEYYSDTELLGPGGDWAVIFFFLPFSGYQSRRALGV